MSRKPDKNKEHEQEGLFETIPKREGRVFSTVGAQDQLPVTHTWAEFPLVGKSNVGKSSLTNALCNAKLARTSKDPGRTRMIHFYQMPVNGGLLVDLPGFGFHKASKTAARKWAPLMQAYFRHQFPAAVLYLQDCRRDFSTEDFDFVESLRDAADVWLILTKTDKLNQKEFSQREKYFAGQPFKQRFFVSSLKPGKYAWKKFTQAMLSAVQNSQIQPDKPL